MLVQVPEPLRLYIEAALTRLKYLYPSVRFSITSEGIQAEADDSDITAQAPTREIHYAVYREKIYIETLTMRRSLIEAVTKR
jgi:hypothetical protein